jgi:hypothetical protein
MQIAFPGCLISADKSITAGHFPGGGTPAETGSKTAVKIGQVFEIGTDDTRVPKIMKPLDKVPHNPSAGERRTILIVKEPNSETFCHASREFDFAQLLEFKQKNASGPFFVQSVRLPPVPVPAEQF